MLEKIDDFDEMLKEFAKPEEEDTSKKQNQMKPNTLRKWNLRSSS